MYFHFNAEIIWLICDFLLLFCTILLMSYRQEILGDTFLLARPVYCRLRFYN